MIVVKVIDDRAGDRLARLVVDSTVTDQRLVEVLDTLADRVRDGHLTVWTIPEQRPPT